MELDESQRAEIEEHHRYEGEKLIKSVQEHIVWDGAVADATLATAHFAAATYYAMKKEAG